MILEAEIQKLILKHRDYSPRRICHLGNLKQRTRL
jgi:hypothetical protein